MQQGGTIACTSTETQQRTRSPMPMARGSNLGLLKEKLAAAEAITVLTGAGISADSGVPTFRGADGLWRNFRAEELATPEAFERDPRLVWEWYNWRRELIATKQPNDAHKALARTGAPLSGLLADDAKCGRAASRRRLTETLGDSWQYLEGSLYRLRRGGKQPRCADCHSSVLSPLRIVAQAPYRLVRRILVC